VYNIITVPHLNGPHSKVKQRMLEEGRRRVVTGLVVPAGEVRRTVQQQEAEKCARQQN